MHEASLAKNIIEIISSNTELTNGVRIQKVNLRVGELAGIYHDSLQFYFTEMSKGTVAENALLFFECIPIVGKCRECTNEFILQNFEINCPKCGLSKFDIISGNEFEIVNIEVE